MISCGPFSSSIPSSDTGLWDISASSLCSGTGAYPTNIWDLSAPISSPIDIFGPIDGGRYKWQCTDNTESMECATPYNLPSCGLASQSLYGESTPPTSGLCEKGINLGMVWAGDHWDYDCLIGGDSIQCQTAPVAPPPPPDDSPITGYVNAPYYLQGCDNPPLVISLSRSAEYSGVDNLDFYDQNQNLLFSPYILASTPTTNQINFTLDYSSTDRLDYSGLAKTTISVSSGTVQNNIDVWVQFDTCSGSTSTGSTSTGSTSTGSILMTDSGSIYVPVIQKDGDGYFLSLNGVFFFAVIFFTFFVLYKIAKKLF